MLFVKTEAIRESLSRNNFSKPPPITFRKNNPAIVKSGIRESKSKIRDFFQLSSLGIFFPFEYFFPWYLYRLKKLEKG